MDLRGLNNGDNLLNCPVMIVGAGPAGISTWLHLQREDPCCLPMGANSLSWISSASTNPTIDLMNSIAGGSSRMRRSYINAEPSPELRGCQTHPEADAARARM